MAIAFNLVNLLKNDGENDADRETIAYSDSDNELTEPVKPPAKQLYKKAEVPSFVLQAREARAKAAKAPSGPPPKKDKPLTIAPQVPIKTIKPKTGKNQTPSPA